MSFRLSLLMLAITAGCTPPENTALINSSAARLQRMDSTMSVTERGYGHVTLSNKTSEVTFNSNGFEYTFEITTPIEVVIASQPFIAFDQTKHSIHYQTYLECITNNKQCECEEFSCQSSTKDGRRTVRVTMNHGD